MPSPSTHLRAPLLWILGPFMAGCVAAKLWPLPASGPGPWLGVAAVGAASAVVWGMRAGRGAMIGWCASIVLAAGVAGFVALHLRYPHLHERDTRPIREVTATVEVLQVFPPTPDARSVAGIGRVRAASEFETDLVGRRVYFSAIRRISVPPHPGGHYVMTGVLEPMTAVEPDDGFAGYLENLGVRQRLTRVQAEREVVAPGWFATFCGRAQDHLEGILRHGVSGHPQTTSIYLAMLLGERAALAPAQEAAFMRSGTFHIFSISGLHVGVISLALYSVLQFFRLPGYLRMGLNLALLWLYVQITGGSSPAERAFLMIAFLLGSRALWLPGNGLAALAAAALLTLLLDPLQLFNTGFQMSYSVVVALVVMAVPLGEKWLARWRPFALLPKENWAWHQRSIEWLGRGIIGSAAASWVAFLASTAAGIGYFNLFSLGALAANLLIIPLSSLAIIAGFLSLLTGLVGLLPLSALFNAAATLTLIITDWLVQRGTQLPGVYFPAEFRATWLTPAALVGFTVLLLGCVAGGWRQRYGGYWPPIALIALLLIFGVKFGGD